MVDRRRKKLKNEGGEKRYMRIKSNEKGITLIALIITIVLNCSYLAMERMLRREPILQIM